MKKFIKKSIAGLIAGIMAISSMPFTALADTASDKALIQSKIDSGAPTYATTTSISGNALSNHTGYMNNILVSGNYAADRNSAQFSYDGSCYYSIVGHALDSVVAIYDGVNAVKIPVSVEAKNAHTSNAAHTYAGIDHVALKNGGQFSLGNGTWIRANSWVDYGDSSDTSHDFSTDESFNKTRGNNTTGYFEICYTNWGTQKPQAKQWKNYITFTPDSSFDTNYYASLTTLAYKCQADTYVSWTGGSGNKQDIAADTSDYTVNYKVINYAPLKNLLNSDDLKNTFKTVSANENDYVSSTVSAYYSALAALYNFNLTDGLTVDTVASKANQMKTLISDYNTAKDGLKKIEKHTYTFIKANYESVTCEAQDDSAAYFWGVTAGNAKNTADTAKTYADNNQHTWVTYSWPTEATNYEFVEKSEQKFEACNYVDGVCTVCGHTSIDYSAFDAAVKAAEELTNEDEKYTADSFAAYQAKVAEIKAKRDTVANQAELDALITELANAQDLLKAAAFTVKLVYVDEDGNETTADTKTVKYGETYDAVSDKNVDKWTVETDNGQTTTKLNVFDKTVSVIITKDATIKAFQTEEATEVATSKVTFVGKNNVVVAIKYVQEGYEFNTSEVAVPAVPFYSSNGWDTESITGDGKEYTVRAVYTCTQSEDDMCNVHFGEWSKKYSYDSYVYLFNADKSKKYALYSDEACTQLLTILDGVDFYAPKTSNIYVKEYTETLADAVIGVTGTFVETTDSAKSAVYNCKFYLPENATAIEWGLEVTLNGKTVNVKAEKKSSRNEYSVRLNAPTTFTGEISGRAYVTYKLGDQTITKYSSAVNQTL